MDRRRRFRQRSSEGAGPTGPRLQNRWRALRGVLGGFDSHALPPNIMISLAFVDLALAVSKLSPKTVPWRPAQCVQRKGNERAQNENEPAIRDPRAVGGHDHTSRDRRSWQSGRRWPGAAAPTHVPREKSLRSTGHRSRKRGLLSSWGLLWTACNSMREVQRRRLFFFPVIPSRLKPPRSKCSSPQRPESPPRRPSG